MITGITTTGFKYELEDTVTDDWELMEVLRKIDKGDAQMVIDAFEIMLGEEQYNRLKNHLRKDGKLKASDMISEFVEIVGGTKEKNL